MLILLLYPLLFVSCVCIPLLWSQYAKMCAYTSVVVLHVLIYHGQRQTAPCCFTLSIVTSLRGSYNNTYIVCDRSYKSYDSCLPQYDCRRNGQHIKALPRYKTAWQYSVVAKACSLGYRISSVYFKLRMKRKMPANDEGDLIQILLILSIAWNLVVVDPLAICDFHAVLFLSKGRRKRP